MHVSYIDSAGDVPLKKLSEQLYFSIIQGSKGSMFFHLDIKASLTKLDDLKKADSQAYRDAAERAYLSIAQNNKFYTYGRLEAVRVLEQFEAKENTKVVQGYLSITEDDKAVDKAVDRDRLKAANQLRLIDKKYEETSAKAYLSMAKNAQGNSYDRLESAHALNLLGDAYKKMAAEAYSVLAQDEKVYTQFRIASASILTKFDGDTNIKIAEQVLSSIAWTSRERTKTHPFLKDKASRIRGERDHIVKKV